MYGWKIECEEIGTRQGWRGWQDLMDIVIGFRFYFESNEMDGEEVRVKWNREFRRENYGLVLGRKYSFFQFNEVYVWIQINIVVDVGGDLKDFQYMYLFFSCCVSC